MQPQDTHIDSDADASPLAQLSRVRGLWFRADFHACLRLLDDLEAREALEGSLRSEACLLRARALYRLRRFDDVVKLLGPALSAFTAIEEACTARMLHATALARSGAVDRGLVLLNEVAASAQGLHVHRAIMAEIWHSLALVHWLKRELVQVLRYASQSESMRIDVISVRATQLRGFVALTMQRFPEALALFRDAHAAYRACKERDDDLEQTTVLQIASLELTLRSARVSGTHDVPWRRPAREPGAGVASVVKMQLCTLDAWLYAHDGDRERAFRNIRLAERLAPDEVWRTWALAGRAAIANAFGNVDSAREHAAEAAEIAQLVDWETTTGEGRIALLFLVEVLVMTNAPLALSVYKQYTKLKPKAVELDGFWKDDPRATLKNRRNRVIIELDERQADFVLERDL
jgi:tetratricopeptide (TPR) repeat protein